MTQHFGRTSDGSTVTAVDIGSDVLKVRLLSLGAIINDVRLQGVTHGLTLGTPDIAAYEGPLETFGSVIGPVVGRIGGASAMIAGQRYYFDETPPGGMTLHSGSTATQRQNWRVSDVTDNSVRFSLVLPNGWGGFPGNREIHVIYAVTGATLSMTITGHTDATTVFSPANHSYWRLDPEPGFSGHTLEIPADLYTPLGPDLLPLGHAAPVQNTDLDCRIGKRLSGDGTQFWDCNFCLSDGMSAVKHMCTLKGQSGVTMEMHSTYPGLQVYDCGSIHAPEVTDNDGHPLARYCGLALEAQFWPGAAANPDFPAIELHPGQEFQSITEWWFSR